MIDKLGIVFFFKVCDKTYFDLQEHLLERILLKIKNLKITLQIANKKCIL